MFFTDKQKVLRKCLIQDVIEEMKTNFFIIKSPDNCDYSNLAEIFNKNYTQRIKKALQEIDQDQVKYLLNSHRKQQHILYLMNTLLIIDENEYNDAVNSINKTKMKLKQKNHQVHHSFLKLEQNNIIYNELEKMLLSMTNKQLANTVQRLCEDEQYYQELMLELNTSEQLMVSELLEQKAPSTNLSLTEIKKIDTTQRCLK